MANSKEEVTPATETVEEVEQPPKEEETKPVEEKKKKPVKEKKQKEKTPKEKKPKQPKAPSHPPYFQMIKEALLALNDKNGSSPYAIAKYMEEHHKAVLPSNFKKILSLQLKNSASRGKLTKIKASYKLSEEGKKGTPPVTKEKPITRATRANAEKKKTEGARMSTRKTRSVKKVNETGKKVVKKVSGGKRGRKASGGAKPKQPKSIKSPVAKRAKKASAAA